MKKTWTILLVLGLSACSSAPSKRPRSGSQPEPPASSSRYTLEQDIPPAPEEIPPDIDKTPDPIPVVEPPSRSGNPKTYEVFGKTYTVMRSVKPSYTERGKASYYGKKFHGHKTASGQRYDMFAMTAAHKTLPLPTYVRVTRTDNGKSCIVKVNDRGPFHPGRIIDLSYAAAARIDMIRAGEVPVEITVITPDEAAKPNAPPPAAVPVEPPPFKRGYWLIGRYTDAIDATAVRESLRPDLGDAVDLRLSAENESELLLLAGPYDDSAAAQAARARLEARGLSSQWVTE